MGEFPYVGPPDKANAYGVLLGQLFPTDPKPVHFVGKPQSQIGASLLTNTMCGLLTGDDPKMMTPSPDDSENEKRIGAAILNRPPWILVDNVVKDFQPPAFLAGLTSNRFTIRRLGVNADIDMPNNAQWSITVSYTHLTLPTTPYV